MLHLPPIVLLFAVMVDHSDQAQKGLISVDRLKRIAEKVNSANTTWKAKINFHESISTINVRHFVGVRIKNNRMKYGEAYDYDRGTANFKIPNNFDARTNWPECPSIGHIPNQGNCGSCYAVACASAFTDRCCTAGKVNASRSIQEIMTCCGRCKENAADDGCDGGYMDEAHNFLVDDGIVSGGTYNSGEGCKPYAIKPCNNSCHGDTERAGECKSYCPNKKYTQSYKEDKLFAKSVYMVRGPNVKKDLMQHGPITATMLVYEDFISYESGIYYHQHGDELGWHAVKVIGWGEVERQKYWNVVNSWGALWGENGTFKIRQTKNGCHFGDFMAAIP